MCWCKTFDKNHVWLFHILFQVILAAAAVPLSILLSTPLFLRTKLEVRMMKLLEVARWTNSQFASQNKPTLFKLIPTYP